LPESEFSLCEAARYLGISRGKMWALVKKKLIPYSKNPLDDREKLFKKSDLTKFKEGRDAHHLAG
jgi:excisionase family DNA binding protein